MVIYFDTETTGLHPGQICQLSYIMQTATAVTAKNFFFEVDAVEYSAFLVHGFSVDKLRVLSNGKKFSDRIDEIEQDFRSADMVVSHNVNFDFSFMRAEFERVGRVFAVNKEFCSMKKCTPVCKLMRSNGISYKYPKLSELCAYLQIKDLEIKNTSEQIFGVDAGYHDARFDTTAVYLAVNVGAESENVFSEVIKCL